MKRSEYSDEFIEDWLDDTKINYGQKVFDCCKIILRGMPQEDDLNIYGLLEAVLNNNPEAKKQFYLNLEDMTNDKRIY